ncbi:MAG TPA: hypothetical protein VEU77_00840 [Candidatus Acidoferrales bacterium]|nr:hypothetical protein [Candidatus Acidoferrales bacterium]
MPRIALVGFVAGAAISVLAVLAEHYGPTFGRYALVGNGALIVPSLLAPFAIFLGWTWALRRGGHALELAVFVIGLHFGVGVLSVLDALLYPSSPDITIADAAPGFLFTGALFVLPAALLAGTAYAIARRTDGVAFIVVSVIGFALGAVLGGLFGAGLGLLSGIAVAMVEREPRQTAMIGAILLVAILLVGNLTYLMLLFALPPT